jgi:o-succinylbenzoate synthase
MKLIASFKKHQFKFRFEAVTSRGILRTRESWFLLLKQKDSLTGIGECGPLRGLSIDDRPDFAEKLNEICEMLNDGMEPANLQSYPSLMFGLEMARLDLKNGGRRIYFSSLFTEGKDSIPVNGLIWMGDIASMTQQVKHKISEGFRCIKIKIGALEFNEEIDLIRNIRKEYKQDDIEIRVDANGAFHPDEALEKLKRLADFDLHSIEQPIAAGQWNNMASLCRNSPLPIALDEELIGIRSADDKRKLIETIKPAFIILKPTLLGGFAASRKWIKIAGDNNIGWWVTSALESNIGLNAIAQWTSTLGNDLPQGLGTGQLFTNNFTSPLFTDGGNLYHNPSQEWDLTNFNDA